jgi:hypothetical protein
MMIADFGLTTLEAISKPFALVCLVIFESYKLASLEAVSKFFFRRFVPFEKY